MLDQLAELQRRASAELEACDSTAALTAWNGTYLGRQDGALTMILRGLKDVPGDQRKIVGQRANEIKADL
jgi:phenylalanyl-tRNA synthetase alpha chain